MLWFRLARRAVVVLAVGTATAACTASSDGSTGSSAPVTSDSVSVSTSSQPAGSTPSTTAPPNPPDLSHKMFVGAEIQAGSEFEVKFTGSLRESRGGYLWLQRVDGTRVALLRGDGNSEIPMSYDLNIENAMMLDDGLSGDTSTFVLPPEVDAGQYRLCTANSLGDDCIAVEVVAA